MSCFVHDLAFESPSVGVKALRCWSPRDSVGHEHEYPADRISLVRAGVFARTIAGRRVVADPTQVLFVNRGDVHRFTYPLDGGNCCTVLEPGEETLAELRWCVDPDATRFATDQRCVPIAVARVHHELLRGIAATRREPLAVEEVALELCRALVALGQRPDANPRGRSRARAAGRGRRIVEEVRLVLNARIDRPPTLTMLARAMRCSPYHLSRLFRTHAGMPMRAYVAALRTTEAARWLREGATDLGQLALELGYYDHAHLTRAFTATWGCSPSRFRQAACARRYHPGGGA